VITIKLNISDLSDSSFVLKKQKDYSFAFRKLYKNINLIEDSIFMSKLKAKYKLSSYEINSLKSEVSVKFKQVKTLKDKLENDILIIEDDIKKLKEKTNKTKKETRKLFKLNKKLVYKNISLSKDITFGSLRLVREISYLNNFKDEYKDLITEKTKQYRLKRLLPINYLGSLNDKNSNRYFTFDFYNNNIIYKPNVNTKINISYKVNKNYEDILKRLDLVKDSKLLPISIKLSTTNIYIIFDNSILNNTNFDKREYYKELISVKRDDVTLRKTIAKKYFREQESRLFKDKLENRYCAIDLNPDYIGLSIIDRDDFKIIHKMTFDLSLLNVKSNKSSNNGLSKDINNKRKYEICNVYKTIFSLAKHYKVSHFVIEDLNFKSKIVNDDYKEFNRKTKNVWNINLQLNTIKKCCVNYGLKLIEINPVYSSFIGNIIYNDFDAVNASIEICRRGMNKYIKGSSLYPEITSTIIDTVESRFSSQLPDVQWIKDCNSWRSMYKLLTEAGCKYRWQLGDNKFNCFSQESIKSKVKILISC
jgi:IS605 OrfB family transposase